MFTESHKKDEERERRKKEAKDEKRGRQTLLPFCLQRLKMTRVVDGSAETAEREQNREEGKEKKASLLSFLVA